jgi:hypothetical protein
VSFSVVATQFRFSRARAFVRRHRTWSIGPAVLVVVVLAVAGWLAFRTGGFGKTATPEPAAGGTSCARRLLVDWADGRIDHTYRIACYRQAMKSLPTDLQVYSSAPEDIESALRDRILQSRAGSIRRQSP